MTGRKPMKIKAVILKIENGTVWLARLNGGEDSCGGCSGCTGCGGNMSGGRGKCSLKTGPAFPAVNPGGLPLKEGMMVTASSSALKTTLQFLTGIALPVTAAAAAYVLAPEGKAGGVKIAAMLAAFAATAAISALVPAITRGISRGKKTAETMEITEILYR